MEQMINVSNLLVVLIILIFNALYILGLYKAAQGQYILSKPNSILNNILLGWTCRFKLINTIRSNLYEALIGCVDCMASVHSIIFLTPIKFYFDWQITPSFSLFALWIFYVCILSFILDFFDTMRTLIITLIVKNS